MTEAENDYAMAVAAIRRAISSNATELYLDGETFLALESIPPEIIPIRPIIDLFRPSSALRLT
jgi:hypothetical protein